MSFRCAEPRIVHAVAMRSDAGVGARKEVVLTPERNAPQLTLDFPVVDLEATVIEAAAKEELLIRRVARRLVQ